MFGYIVSDDDETSERPRPVNDWTLPLTFGTKIDNHFRVKCPEAVQWRQGGETLCEINDALRIGCSIGSILHWLSSLYEKKVTLLT